MIEPRERVPYERSTGLPLNLAPTEEILTPLTPHARPHHAHHTRKYVLGLGDIGVGIHVSRIQWALNRNHNGDYKTENWDGIARQTYHSTFIRSKVPISSIGRARVMLFGAATAVSSEVLDFEQETIRPIRDDERKRLFYSGELGMESKEMVSRELTKFTVTEAMQHLTPGEVTAYKDAKWFSDKRSIAEVAIDRLLPVVFQPINARYAEATNQGLLPPDSPRTPAQLAAQFVMAEVNRHSMFNTAFNAWEQDPSAFDSSSVKV